MSRHKWIVGGLGFFVGGPLGAIAALTLENINFGSSTYGAIADADRKSHIIEGQRNGFLLSFLVLSAYIIQADHKILDEEQKYVLDFVRYNFGDDAAEEARQTLEKIYSASRDYSETAWRLKIVECCEQMADYMTEEQRKLLIAFLIKISKTDYDVADEEIAALYDIARWLSISPADVQNLEKEKADSLIESYDSVFMTSDLI